MTERATVADLPPPRLVEEARRAFGPGPIEHLGSYAAGVVLTPQQVEQALSKTDKMRQLLAKDAEHALEATTT